MVQKSLPLYQNIAISGDISSGKSTLAKNLSTKLRWKYLGAGAFFREWHQENHISINDTEQIPEALDRKIDAGFQTQMKKCKNVVFESHLAGWLARDLDQTFRILIIANFDERMNRTALRENSSIKKVTSESIHRAKFLADKFKRLYGIENSFDEKYFNLIIDSTHISKDEVLEIALKALVRKKSKD